MGFEAVKVTDKVYWVGAIDWAVRDFHGYLTSRGTTYNAYLLLGDPPTLVDTVKAPFREEMLERIASVLDPKKIRLIVSHHAEMDHSGSLPMVVHQLRPDKVYASAPGVQALNDHFRLEREVTAVKDGERVDLGGLELLFAETRMLHWPDSMISYLAADKLVFSQDGFGMHLASNERFADELPEEQLAYEGAKYFANILLLYSPLVLKLAGRLGELGWDIRILAPDHGPIWRGADVGKVVGRYGAWAAQKRGAKAVIAYDTMWQSTDLLARLIAEGAAKAGAECRVLPLKSCHRSDVVTELLDAGAFVVGSPTINNQLFPTVADLMTYVEGLKPKGLIGAAFGSYGWSGEAVKKLEEWLKRMKVELAADGLSVKYVPGAADRDRALELGRRIGRALAAKEKEK